MTEREAANILCALYHLKADREYMEEFEVELAETGEKIEGLGDHELLTDAEIDELCKRVAASDIHNITIEVEGGVVQNVHGLPKGWTYDLDDHDMEGAGDDEEDENADIEELVLGLSSNDSGDQDNAGEEGEPLLDIQYACPSCGYEWEERWSCACDSECPECDTGDIQALRWKGVDEEWTPKA